MDDSHDIRVKIAQIKVGTSGDTLKATLGSCVGIAFIWKEKNICGLAHCLLAETEEDFEPSAKYVSHAVPNLMKVMSITKKDVHKIQVYIAGGGNMMAQLSRANVDHIGQLNIAAAKKYLTKYGFSFTELALGGDDGRQILVDCTSGEVSTITLSRVAA